MIVDYDYDMEKTKDNYDILKIFKDEKNIYIGSKYNSQREVSRFLELIKGKKLDRDVFVVYGFGTGDHIKALRKIYNKNSILIFEPNKKVYKYANSLQWVTDDKYIEVICCNEGELNRKIKEYINEFNFKNSEYLPFANYTSLYKEESRIFFNIVNNIVVNIAIDVNTKKFFGKTWFYNVIHSIKYIVKSTPADVYNSRFLNKPAVIVSAGPSLDKNIHELKGSEESFVIMCGGRTLSCLLDKKINPDLLVIADSTERNYTLVKDYLNEMEVPLLFSESANLNILKHHKGRKIFYTYNNLIKKIAGLKISHISTGGSVAHAMVSYAANIGCSPIILIGQDFAYTDKKAHADIAENKDGSYNYEIAVKEDDIYVDDVYGNKIRTSLVLNNQRIAMEKIIKLYPHTKFINATEGGAHIKGTTVMKLNQAIKQYGKETFQKFHVEKIDKNMLKKAVQEMEKLKNTGERLYLSLNRSVEENSTAVIDLYNADETYAMLLYPIIYEYFTCTCETDNIKKMEKLILEAKVLIKESLNNIAEEINELKKISQQSINI